MGIAQEFVSQEQRDFKFKMGHMVASALSGFVAGAVVASIVWLAIVFILFDPSALAQ